jgi:hypothetical protein
MASVNNLRVVADNVAERATVAASTTAGVLAAANLLTTAKSEVWRATGTSARLGLAWAAAETFQAVALPFCNLSPTATMRVRTTNEQPATNLLSYSQQFDNAAWSKTGALKANAVTAPDGTQTGAMLNGSADANIGQGVSTTAGKIYTVSVWLRADTPFTCNLYMYDSNATPVAAPVAVTTSWQRFSASFNAPGASLNLVLGGGGSVNQKNLYIWGAQVELGAMSSYYPTTAGAATRPLGYIDAWQSYTFDSGQVLACPAPAVKLRGWPAAKAASAYAYGGGAYVRYWLPAAQTAVGMAIDIVDANNLQGYIEAACLVVGPYWAPAYNATGPTMTTVDTTALYRTDAGEQGADAGYQYRRVGVDFSVLTSADRAALVGILRGSRAYPVLISLFPLTADLELERDHMVYGRRTKDSDVGLKTAVYYGSTIEIEEI